MEYNAAQEQLHRENRHYAGTGGVSQHNQHRCFHPAFKDENSGQVALSCYADGKPAPFHTLEGLPSSWIKERDTAGKVAKLIPSVIAGFVKDQQFFTRQQAADMVA